MTPSPRVLALAVFVLVLGFVPHSAWSGANADARAFLSWSSEGVVTDATPDSAGQVSLYLHVVGARDVQGIRNEVLWSADLSSGGRLIWPEPASPLGPCGVTDGHPGRLGRILFHEAPGMDFCVAMRMRVDPPSAQIKGRFRPAYVRLTDSGGEIDEIEVETAEVVLNGGGEAGVSFVVGGASPSELLAGGFPDTLGVWGYGFAEGMQASLRSDAGEVLSARVIAQSWTSLSLEIDPRFDQAGSWRLYLKNMSGLTFADSSIAVEVLAGSGPGVWRVPADFAKVRDALEAASPGDTVLVFPGTYEEDHAWIVDKDAVALLGAGADETVIRATNDAVLGIVRSRDVKVSGIRFEVRNHEKRTRLPLVIEDSACSLEYNIFVLEDCRMCGFITHPVEVRLANNTVVRRGVGSNLFARVFPGPGIRLASSTPIIIERNLSAGFDASLACEDCPPPTSSCNWDPGALLDWFSSISSSQPVFVDAGNSDYRPVAGSPALPENNECGTLIGALGRE